MLRITIPPREGWDDSKEEFITFEGQVLTLEHSLVSVSKWESIWKKPFISKQEKSNSEIVSYIKCMTITQNVKDYAYTFLTKANFDAINNYIKDSHTATFFSDYKGPAKRSSEQITSELIYYWMVEYGIPFDPCEKWHLNRLLTLIRICGIKNNSEQKMPKKQALKEQAAINAMRKAKFHTRG